MNYFPAFVLLLIFAIQSPMQDLRPIYDARRSPESAKTPDAEVAILKRIIRPIDRKYWGKLSDNCDGEFELIDVAQGAFTKPQSSQKAFLYRYCATGHNFALNGIAVLEDGQIAAHLVYEGSWDNAVGALPDIDGDGLSEILIATGGTNMGETWGVISVIELSEKGVSKFGITETYSDNCGAVEKGKASAHRLQVRVGATPTFYRETFVSQDCGKNGTWAKSEALKPIVMRKDEIKYQRLK